VIDTIITAFPDRLDRGGENTLLDQINEEVSKNRPGTCDEMIMQVLKQCVRFHDEPTNAGLDENPLDIFELSIAELVS
jgi:hypothetical protein